MPIRWEDVGHEKYEDMVSVLLSRLYPDARRIDGKGGDGGRDVQIADASDGSIMGVFQLKGFTGRVGRMPDGSTARVGTVVGTCR